MQHTENPPPNHSATSYGSCTIITLSTALKALLALFVLLLLIDDSLILRHIPFLPSLETLTGDMTAALANLFTIPASYKDNLLTVAGFRMHMVGECTAFHFMALISMTMLMHPRHSGAYKLAGIAVGVLAIFSANVVRLVLLGLTGAHAPVIFNFTHDFLWQIGFVLFMFLLWEVWARRSLLTHDRLTFAAIALISAALLLFAIGLAADAYQLFLAHVAEMVSGAGLSVTFDNNRFAYDIAGETTTVTLWQDLLGVVIFWSLCTASAFTHKRIRLSATWVAAGTALIMATHVVEVYALGAMLLNHVPTDAIKVILWLVRIVYISVPVLTWHRIIRTSQRTRPAIAFDSNDNELPEGESVYATH